VALAVVLVVLWWKAPALYDSSDVDPSGQATATATTRTGILAVIAATIATLGATLALAETRRANLAAHEREREALAETQRANREADQRERYTKAIDQLGTTGKKKVDVRLGGIYALLRVAEDSDRDLPIVVDVLCAFVRGHGQGPEGDSYRALMAHRPPDDVEAALSVVGGIHNPDLKSRISLRDAHLERAGLGGANLTRASLARAKLAQTYLAGADLTGAYMVRASLTGAFLNDANLSGARLKSADLTRADLPGANLTDANLTGADLHRAKLTDADLSGADLSGARLTDADLSGAHGLTQGQLEDAMGNEETHLPDGFTRPEHWTIPRPPDSDDASTESHGQT
jgi:hypothetical protein